MESTLASHKLFAMNNVIDSSRETLLNQESPKTTAIKVGKLDLNLISPAPEAESGERISFWWGLTSASLALARLIESELDVIDRDLLELGSGVGLPGLVASIRGANVTFSDYVTKALDAARANVVANGALSEKMRFMRLDWEFPSQVGPYDIIIGSEIVYDYFFHGSLTDLIVSALNPQGIVVLADRDRMVVNRFIGRLRKRNFSCEKKNCLISEEGFPVQSITIYILKRS